MILFDIALLFLGISLPLIFAGYIIIRSRKFLGVDFFRKSFWLGMFLPVAYLVIMMVLHGLSPDIYASFIRLNSSEFLVSYRDTINIFVFLLIALSPWLVIGWIYAIFWRPLSRVLLLSNICASFSILFIVISVLPLLREMEIFGTWIALWSMIMVFLNAFSEESNKIIFARIVGWETLFWLMFWGVIIALGFAFCENIFYTLIAYSETTSLSQVSNLLFSRTFFSLGIHMVSMFFALGLFFGAPKKMYFFHPHLILWFLSAITFHMVANILLESGSNLSFVFLWLTLFFGISFGFYRLKQILEQNSDSIWQATL